MERLSDKKLLELKESLEHILEDELADDSYDAVCELLWYRSAGLTAEECLEYKKFEDSLFASNTSFKRLLELVEADKEKRLVNTEAALEKMQTGEA